MPVKVFGLGIVIHLSFLAESKETGDLMRVVARREG